MKKLGLDSNKVHVTKNVEGCRTAAVLPLRVVVLRRVRFVSAPFHRGWLLVGVPEAAAKQNGVDGAA